MISTKEKTDIRVLGPDEAGAAFSVAKSFHKDTGLVVEEPDREYWEAMWSDLISRGVGVIIALEAEGKVVGALCGVCSPSLLAPVMCFSESMWYIEKEWRGYGTRMLRFAEEIAAAKDCQVVNMVHLIDGRAGKMASYYRRNGYTPTEAHYIKVL